MNPRILATIGAVVLLAGCADNPPPPSPFLIIFGVLTYRVCGSPDVGWHVEAP